MKRVGLVEEVFVTVNLLKQLLEFKKKLKRVNGTSMPSVENVHVNVNFKF
jgi:hypothetical protein